MRSAVEVVIGWKHSLNMFLKFFFEEVKGRSSSQREKSGWSACSQMPRSRLSMSVV
jgi:hypothetical protein